ncbi:MAG: M20/M25/M40 family metallo-hydrolase [Candidatus Electryonea clarkiae]|nr:M20/M25/M40 family metallo-hydrolase [Candidatus Electryonea clarkiae]MDP8285860.1 M20/M25/M40 family metallo-hydrolase [Candidatus Electryonea clarkiae]
MNKILEPTSKLKIHVFLKFILELLLLLLLYSTSVGKPSVDRPDFDKAGREAARILSDIIRLDSTNPPGNESLVADYLSEVLDREGIQNISLAKVEGRDNLIARYHGTGKADPILLYSHSDVVPADPGWGVWTVPPFSGEVRNGTLYGRGAIDAKGLAVSHISALILLKRNNVILDRDVIVLVAAAEETGGGPGMKWLLENHRELIDAEVALGEGGRVWERADSVWSVWLQAGEKSAHNLKITAIGETGHSAVRSSRNAIERLNKALLNIQQYQFETRMNPVSERFLDIIQPFQKKLKSGNPRYEAIIRSIASVTLIKGGIKTNVIPDFAEANLNLRLLPGEDLDVVTRELNEVTGLDGITVRHRTGSINNASIVSFETPFYESISETAQKLWSEAVIAPYLSPGTSDASKLRKAGILTYGLMPFPLTAKESSTIHGVDERIRLESLKDGIEFTYEIVLNWAAEKE